VGHELKQILEMGEKGKQAAKDGDYVQAIELYTNCLEFEISSDDIMIDENKYYTNRGFAYFKMGNITEACQDYERAIQADPKRMRSYQRLSQAYQSQREFDKAIECCKRAIEQLEDKKSIEIMEKDLEVAELKKELQQKQPPTGKLETVSPDPNKKEDNPMKKAVGVGAPKGGPKKTLANEKNTKTHKPTTEETQQAVNGFLNDVNSGNFVLKPTESSTKSQKKKPGISMSLRSQLAVTLENNRSKLKYDDDNENDDSQDHWD